MKKRYVYDIEVFPNAFLACFQSWPDGERIHFEITPATNNLNSLKTFLCTAVEALIGYNNHRYDDHILMHCLYYQGVTNATLFNMSKALVEQNARFYWEGKIQPWVSYDLMRLHRFDAHGNYVSLKALAVVLNHEWIQDLPYEPDRILDRHDFAQVLRYCWNDVNITAKVLEQSIDEIRQRHEMGEEYSIDVHSDSRSFAGMKVLARMYQDKHGIDPMNLRGPTRDEVPFLDVISPAISFSTPALQSFLKQMKSFVSSEGNRFNERLQLGTIGYTVAEGGIHDLVRNRIWRGRGKWHLLDADFGSYYPNLMINLGIEPEHLKGFLDLLKAIVTQRLAYKAEGNKSRADQLKIVINAIFGNLGFPGGFLYDRLAFLRVTINGQLFMLMLAEALEADGHRIVYGNTDGISMLTCRPQDAARIVKAFSKWCRIPIDLDAYDRFVISNVSNYIWFPKDTSKPPKIKGKTFRYRPELTSGLDRPVIARALVEHFTDGTSPTQIISQATDILEFTRSEKVSKKFDLYFCKSDQNGNLLSSDPIQRTVRYAIGLRSGTAIKKVSKETGREYTMAHADNGVILLNNIDQTRGRHAVNYDLNLQHYIQAADNIIRAIENGPDWYSILNPNSQNRYQQ